MPSATNVPTKPIYRMVFRRGNRDDCRRRQAAISRRLLHAPARRQRAHARRHPAHVAPIGRPAQRQAEHHHLDLLEARQLWPARQGDTELGLPYLRFPPQFLSLEPADMDITVNAWPPTEREIQQRVDRMISHLDRLLANRDMSEEDYHKAMADLSLWEEEAMARAR